MSLQYCPYLGIYQDRETTVDFPSEANACWRSGSARPITLDHQENFCLVDKYPTCPIYLAQGRVRTPGVVGASRPQLRNLFLVIISLLIVFGVLFLGKDFIRTALSTINAQGNDPNQISPADIALTEAAKTETALSEQMASSATPDMAALRSTLSACLRPSHYLLYFIQPEDDIFQLAAAHGITLQQLLVANCFDNIDKFLPGLMIIIPVIVEEETTATATHTATQTPTSTTPARTATPTPTPTDTPRPTAQATPTNPPKPTKTPKPPPPTETPPDRP